MNRWSQLVGSCVDDDDDDDDDDAEHAEIDAEIDAEQHRR